MFIGHFSIALAAKKVAPRTSLGTMFLSVGFLDVLWPFFVLFGWEHARVDPGNTAVTPLDLYDYPYSHSLVAGLGWALLFGALYYAATRYRRGAIVVALGVLSHWVLDALSHRPDMPIWMNNDGPKVGLGLWNSIPATLIVETLMYAAAVAIYAKVTRPIDKTGTWAFVSLIATLYVIYIANIFGPPPPNIEMIGYMAPAVLALFAWPYWIDRHRQSA